jgi:hypothetical protein
MGQWSITASAQATNRVTKSYSRLVLTHGFTLTPRFSLKTATEWRSGKIFPSDLPLTIEIPPGRTVFLELVLQSAKESSP